MPGIDDYSGFSNFYSFSDPWGSKEEKPYTPIYRLPTVNTSNNLPVSSDKMREKMEDLQLHAARQEVQLRVERERFNMMREVERDRANMMREEVAFYLAQVRRYGGDFWRHSDGTYTVHFSAETPSALQSLFQSAGSFLSGMFNIK